MQTANLQGELWGARAEDWTELCEPQTRPLWAGMQEATYVGPGTRYLDLGCGGGSACKLATQNGAEVSGFDASEALLAVARRQAPNADFRKGDLESLPYADDSFDVITAANVVQFVENKPRALREIKRVLAPGGKFVIGMWAEPEKCEMAAVFKAVTEAVPGPPNHEPSLTVRDTLVDLVEKNGFQVVEEREVECVFEWSSFEECWRGIRSAGMMEGASRAVGDEPIRNAIQTAVEPFTQPGGTIRMSNTFRYLVCK